MLVNRERVKLLVDALRSNKYTQGRGVLARYSDKDHKVEYCCLGVACEVAIENGLELTRQLSSDFDNPYYMYRDTFHGVASTILPKAVMDWFGFESENPLLIVPLMDLPEKYHPNDLDTDPVLAAASACNDDFHLNFTKIADFFENTYLKSETDNDNA